MDTASVGGKTLNLNGIALRSKFGFSVYVAWNEGLAANDPNASAAVKKSFETLCEWMTNVKSGEEIVIAYIPGQGTRVWVGGNIKGSLAGKETADAILSTWIGPKPGPGDIFKNNILGK